MGCPASGSRHSMAYVKETTAGTTPATPVFTPIRMTSTSLALTKNATTSAELRGDRQISDHRHGSKRIGGDIGVELSYGGFVDDFLEAVLCGTWTGDVLKAGTTRRAFTIERIFNDLSADQYLRYKGCELNTWSLTISPDAIVTSTFGIVGRSMDAAASAAIAGATYNNPTTTTPFDSFTGTLLEGGTANAAVTELSLELNNGLNPLFPIFNGGEAGCVEIGRSNLTGSATMFFESATHLNKFINETESSLEFALDDGTNSYTIQLPRIKYNGGQPDVQGEGSILITLPFQALYDDTEDSNIVITRVTG